MTTDPGGTVTLQLKCDKCGYGINLWCEGWTEGGQAQSLTYECPWCGANQRTEIPAARVSASKRDDDFWVRNITATIIQSL